MADDTYTERTQETWWRPLSPPRPAPVDAPWRMLPPEPWRPEPLRPAPAAAGAGIEGAPAPFVFPVSAGGPPPALAIPPAQEPSGPPPTFPFPGGPPPAAVAAAELPVLGDPTMPFPGPVAEAPVAPAPAPGRAAVPPDLARAGIMSIISPEAIRARLQEFEGIREQHKELTAKQAEDLDRRLLGRQKMEAAALTALGDYQTGLNSERPSLQTLRETLKTLPTPPDLKIRPWLDPEGKNALLAIGESLKMMALGIGGVVNKAPFTAARLFRESAELWRRDQIDAAESKWKQFQAETLRLNNENDQALKLYDLAERRYGSNIQAKHAAVLAGMEGLKLFDSATATSQLPYDLGRQALDKQSELLKTTLEGQLKYGDLMRHYQKAGDTVSKNAFETRGQVIALEQALQSGTVTDPDELARMKATLAVKKDQLQQHDAANLQSKTAFAEAATGYRIAAVGIKETQQKMTLLNSLMFDTMRLDDAIKVLHEEGKLPKDKTPFWTWVKSWQNRVPGSWSDQAERAYETVQQQVPSLLGSYDRVVQNMIGNKAAIFFSIPKDPAKLTVNQLESLVEMLAGGAKEARPLYEERLKLYKRLMPSLGGLMSPGGAEAPEQTDEEPE